MTHFCNTCTKDFSEIRGLITDNGEWCEVCAHLEYPNWDWWDISFDRNYKKP